MEQNPKLKVYFAKGDFKGSEDLVNFPAFRVDFTVRVD